MLQALNIIELTSNEVKMFCTKGRNCGDYRDKTCCDFVTIGTKHFLTNVKSIESHRIEYE